MFLLYCNQEAHWAEMEAEHKRIYDEMESEAHHLHRPHEDRPELTDEEWYGSDEIYGFGYPGSPSGNFP